MVDSDKLKFAELMTAMCVTFDKEPTQALMTVYFDALSDMTIEEVTAGIGQAVRRSRFMPKPAEIREFVTGDPEANANEAWMAATEAIHSVGAYRACDFTDPAINATVRALGGWTAFCGMSPSEESFWRARFLKTYQAYRRSGVSKEAGRPLTGIGQATDVKRIGQRVMFANRPKRIGGPSK